MVTPSGDRTAPYWRHVMVIDVFAVMANGVWFYDSKRHVLQQHSRVDPAAYKRLEQTRAIRPSRVASASSRRAAAATMRSASM